jgi:hypothetical protein
MIFTGNKRCCYNSDWNYIPILSSSYRLIFYLKHSLPVHLLPVIVDLKVKVKVKENILTLCVMDEVKVIMIEVYNNSNWVSCYW